MSVLFEELYPPTSKAMGNTPPPSVRMMGSASGSASGASSGSLEAEGFPAMWALGFIVLALVIIHMSE